MYISCLISKMKVTWTPIFLSLLWLFIVSAFFSQFFSRGIRMHILMLTRVQNGRISCWKNSQNLIKNVLLEVNFQDEGPLYANSYLPKIPSFLVRMSVYIPILTRVRNERISRNAYFKYRSFSNILEISLKNWVSCLFLPMFFYCFFIVLFFIVS